MMEYRRLEKKDAALLLQFEDDCRTVYETEKITRFLAQRHALGFVAAEDEKIAAFAFGYVLMKPDGRLAFYLHAIDVMAAYQGRGIGSGLMRYIHEHIRGMGCSKMFLLTEEENRAACACYEKAGGMRKDAVLYEFT